MSHILLLFILLLMKSYSFLRVPESLLKENENYLKNITNNILVPRVVGSNGHELVKNFIINELRNLDLTIGTDDFSAPTPIFGYLKFTNIIGKYNTDSRNTLTLACHYDSKYFPENPNFTGAIDSAVPCAIILETAKRVLNHIRNSKEKINVGLMLVFFDGEEAFLDWTAQDSLYGSRHLANEFSKTLKGDYMREIDNIEVLVLLDLIGAKHIKIPNFAYNTKELHKALIIIEQKLYGQKSMNSKDYIFKNQTIFGFIDDDHSPFLRKNVPILHLIAHPFPDQWHKRSDNAENLHWPSILRFSKIFRAFTYLYLTNQPIIN